MFGSTPTIGRSPRTHVALAVIVNERNEVLIGKRADHVHLGGYWEFPGGKREVGESAEAALVREVLEETGLTVASAKPLIAFEHCYLSKRIHFSVFKVESVEGRLFENDNLWQWVTQRDLPNYAFPAANQTIIKALGLPSIYPINGHFESTDELLHKFQKLGEAGVTLACFRATHLSDANYLECAQKLTDATASDGPAIVLNADPGTLKKIPQAAGIHLNSQRLMSAHSRQIDSNKLLLASCHSEDELKHACHIGVDAIVLSPVQPTLSHPGTQTLGWEEFQRLVGLANVPVYALGGMTRNDETLAQQLGGQGVAGIGSFWGV